MAATELNDGVYDRIVLAILKSQLKIEETKKDTQMKYGLVVEPVVQAEVIKEINRQINEIIYGR